MFTRKNAVLAVLTLDFCFRNSRRSLCSGTSESGALFTRSGVFHYRWQELCPLPIRCAQQGPLPQRSFRQVSRPCRRAETTRKRLAPGLICTIRVESDCRGSAL